MKAALDHLDPMYMQKSDERQRRLVYPQSSAGAGGGAYCPSMSRTESGRKLGFFVITAKEGETAFGLFKAQLRSSERFDAVILDLTVPDGWGGMETLEAIREIDPDVPVCVSSGYVDKKIIARPERFGFSVGLRKPFRFRDLSSMPASFSVLDTP